MRTKKYNLMTLNPKEMLNHYDVIKTESGNYAISYCYDLSSSSLIDNMIIAGIDSFDENALLYQLEKVVRKPGDDSWNEDSLQHYLLYIDFSEVFRNIHFDENKKQSYKKEELAVKTASDDTKLSFLFDPDNGIQITFIINDQKIKKTFVPYDKSSSMARNCRITFIDKDKKEQLDKRLLLDFDFHSIDMVLSKYYAYRGLYLTSAHRIDMDDQLVLNEETVIVIRDDKHDVYGEKDHKGNPNKHVMFKEIGKDEKDGILWKLGETLEDSVNITPFDGEGLVSKKYAHLINRKLGKYGKLTESEDDDCFKSEASTYQIRMPFTKGVLHAVDFNSFINEFVSDSESVMITDIFGVQRDIRKAEIILTESMFKCSKWIKKIWKEWIKSGHTHTTNDDIMKFFFQKMYEYDHSLYVGNTNLVLSDVNTVKMNYQFFNTLDIPADDFEKMVMKHNLQAGNVNELFLNDTNDMSEDAVDDYNAPVWQKALRKNKSFLQDPKIKGLIKGTEETLLIDCAGGRIRVTGECRFLSCDLLALMLYIIKCLEKNNETKKNRELLKTLYSERFYMPKPKISLSPDKYYGIFRSPHLSRNEQVVLMPYIAKKDSVYDKYFSHLSGIIMLSRNSLVPNTLAGADFDGDLVKIVSQEEIVNAIKRSVYIKDQDEDRVLRKLAIIEIPKTTAEAVRDHGFIPYETIKNTFSNNVGQISNLAIKIGKKEYFEKNEAFANKCAECTVVTGLEIDAAKTGAHPTRNISELKKVLNDNGVSASEKDYFLNASEVLSSLGRSKFFVRIEQSGKQFRVKQSRGKKALLSIEPYQLSDNVANIDRLPYYYAQEKINQKEQKKESKKINKATGKVLFVFQAHDPDWKKKLNKELLEETKQLILAYKAVMGMARRIYQSRVQFASSNYLDRVITILKIQYDSLYSLLPCGMPVRIALDSVYSFLDEHLLQPADAENALKKLIDLRWQNSAKNEQVDLMKSIISLDEERTIPKEAVDLLCNFDNGGYNLLYYILQQLISERLKYFTPEQYEERMAIKDESKDESINLNKYYKILYSIYCNSANNKETKKVWQKKLIGHCRIFLSTLFADDMDNALKYVFANRGTDQTATFFWDVLPEKTILKNIFENPWKGEKNDVE